MNDSRPPRVGRPVSAELKSAESAFSRSMVILEAIARRPGTTLRELNRRLPYPDTTGRRLVTGLVKDGLVLRQDPGGKLFLSPRMTDFAARLMPEPILRRISQDQIFALRNTTNETVELLVPDQSQLRMVCISFLPSQRHIYVHSRIGRSIDLNHSIAGKSILTAMNCSSANNTFGERELGHQTDRIPISTMRCNNRWGDTAPYGFTHGHEGSDIDIVSASATILDHRRSPVGCLLIRMPAFRFKSTSLPDLRVLMVAAVETISFRLQESACDGELRGGAF